MALEALSTPRFIRKTQLGANEYRKNFHQLDGDAVSAVTSPEADRVTPLMSKIYLRLVSAPTKFWERQGVLRFESEVREGKQVTAWVQLRELLGVASATASKALAWMHEVGVIGYFAGKNGVGIRIFINRATSSVGTRAPQGKKFWLSLLLHLVCVMLQRMKCPLMTASLSFKHPSLDCRAQRCISPTPGCDLAEGHRHTIESRA